MENPTYHLEGVVRSKSEMQDFDGPLALILMLLSKNRIAIRDIKVSEILDQYLEFIAKMQSMDIEVASEFMQMASHLLYIKTKSLLPSTEEPSELEELITSLESLQSQEIYSRLKGVTDELGRAYSSGALLFTKPREPIKTLKEYSYSHEPSELFAAILPLLRRENIAEAEADMAQLTPKPITYSLLTKTRELISLLRSRGSEKLTKLFSECSSRTEIVATFVSLLELCNVGTVAIFGAGDELTVTFTGGDDAESILEVITE